MTLEEKCKVKAVRSPEGKYYYRNAAWLPCLGFYHFIPEGAMTATIKDHIWLEQAIEQGFEIIQS